MKFYSGFSLKNDKTFFKEYINDTEYTISGFSYGAIRAFEETYALVHQGKRVETLQLFSPAFFQTKSEKFKRMQLMGYKRDSSVYLNQFIGSCFSPYPKGDIEHSESKSDELNELLSYEWSVAKLNELESRGVKIEVYLGSNDIVIDVVSAREFFLALSSVTYIKNANHFLQTK